ncbi:MAG: hypothetical protein AAGJ81_10630 [Verrucomicrobiota bacterium]
MDTNKDTEIEVFPVRWVVIDLETTGLDWQRHGIVEMAAKTDSGEVFELDCAPFHPPESVELEALGINGRLWPVGVTQGNSCSWNERLMPQNEAVVRLLLFLMQLNPGGRWTLVGRNPRFDMGFLKNASGLTDRVLDQEPIDLHDLVRAELVRRGNRPARFTTDERYSILGYETEPLPHTAVQGVNGAWEVARRFLTADYTDGPGLNTDERGGD